MLKKLILSCLIISSITYILFSMDLFISIDNKITDKHFLSHPAPVKAPIIILAIDDYSIEKFKIWPWPRKIYTDLVNILTREKAAVISFDIDFDSSSSYDNSSDLAFGDAIKKAGNVILARQSKKNRNNETFFVDPIAPLKKEAQLGIVQPILDKDRFIRRGQLTTEINQTIHPFFAFAVMSKYLHLPINAKTIDKQTHKIKLGKIYIQNKIIINYAGSAQSFPTIPIAKVLEPEFFKHNKDLFKDKIILIGSTALNLQDLYGTPTDMSMPGVEIHANIINTVLSGQFIKKIDQIKYFWMILISTLFISFFTTRYKAVAGLLALLTLSISYFALSKLLFAYALIIQIASPIFSSFIGYLATIFAMYRNEEKKKNEIRHIFNQYVSPGVVHELLSDKTKLKLGGDKKDVSIFFSDIRGFTTLSENHTPEEVITQLNEYLNAMAEVIFEYGGTLDKFVGDEIMAVWGAPLPQANHAELAVRAALKQLEALEKLQAKWAAEGKPIIDIGIGINSGEVIVGNVGAEKYKDYTVIGDEVNLAARLQAYTRNISTERDLICRFIISDKTKKRIEGIFTLAPLGEITVKGKKNIITIWEVLGEEKVAER